MRPAFQLYCHPRVAGGDAKGQSGPLTDLVCVTVDVEETNKMKAWLQNPITSKAAGK